MPIANPWKSYRQTATLTAPPGQVVLLLYNGAISRLERSLLGFAHDDPALLNMTVNNNILRAQEIIRELNCALDMERGGELAGTLRRLYDYFDDRLCQSNLKKDRTGIEEVIGHLTVLRDAWDTMLKNPEGTFVSESVPAPAFATV